MVKISVLLVSVASLFFTAPAFAQTPSACEKACESIARIEACQDTDLTCVCGEQIILDSQECLKCVEDAGINTSLVPGFNEILPHHAEICEEAIKELLPSSSSTTNTPTQTTPDPSPSPSQTDGAVGYGVGVKGMAVVGAGMVAALL